MYKGKTIHFFHQGWSCGERKKVVITENGYKNEWIKKWRKDEVIKTTNLHTCTLKSF